MGRVNHEDAVHGESRRTRIHVANSGQKQRRQQLPVRNTAPELLYGHLRAFVARRILDQGDQRLNLGPELDGGRSELRIGSAQQQRRGQQPMKNITSGNHLLFTSVGSNNITNAPVILFDALLTF